MKLSEISIIKSRSGVYQDNAENRRKHRVGQRYGEDKKEDPEEGKEPSNEEWGSITSKMSAEEIQNKLNNMSALDGKVSEEQKASLRKYLEKQLEAKKSEEKSEEPKQEASGQASEADKDDLREARRKLSYLQDNEERLIKRDGKEKYDKRVKQVKEVIAKLRGEKPKESQKPEYFDRTGYKPIYRMNEEEADKFISDAKKYLSENKDAKDVEQVQDVIRKVELRKEEIKETSNEEAEVYTRIKFDDVPNSGKVNLKKYLSGKMKRSADEAWGDISKIETKDLQKMERGLVEDFNRQFDDLPKSRRAEKLYAIMKVKGELSKRGKEDQKKTPEVKQEPLSPQELKKAIRTKTKELSNDTLQKLKGLKKEDVEVGLDDRGRLFTNINGYDFYFDESNFEEDKNGYVRMFENNPQDVFFKKQAEAAVKLENYDIESSRKDMNFTSDEELKTFQSANSLIKNSNYSEAEVSEMKNFFNKGVKDMLASVPEHDKRRIFSKYRYFMSDSLGIDAAQKLMRDDSKGFNEIQNKDILINSALMNNGYLPIMSGSLFSNYKGEKFNEYRYEGNDDWYQEMSSRALKNADDPNIEKALRSYTEGKAYEKIRAHLSGEGELSPQAKKTLDSIENFMNKSSLEENMILYRRLKANPKSEGGLNSLNDFYKLDVGDEFEDKSFGSYAPQPNSNFGDDFQITLMAKKGSKISPIGNGLMFEQEFLANKGMKFRVVAKGTNSIAVEIVD